MATQSASTKRTTVTGGKSAAPTENLDHLKITPLQPVDADLLQRVQIDTPHELLQTFTEESDIKEGDILVVSGADHPVRSVANWTFDSDTTYLHLIVEDLKT